MPAPPRILGLHHVTAIASDAQKNIDFYTGVLGLKIVKINVNQDDPTSLHLYYGDDQASPGSLVTFFVYPGMGRAVEGAAGVSIVSLENLSGFATSGFEELRDPDGLQLWLSGGNGSARLGMPVLQLALDPADYYADDDTAVDAEDVPDPFQEFCERFLGLRLIGAQGDPAGWHHLGFSEDAEGYQPLIHYSMGARPAHRGAGSVHHTAFRIATDDEQAELHARLTEAGVEVSPIIDRVYFKSIYFREPGGILLEVATDGPGFAVDEPPDRLGRTLCLPPWLEPHRAEIERAIPRLVLPTGEVIGGR